MDTIDMTITGGALTAMNGTITSGTVVDTGGYWVDGVYYPYGWTSSVWPYVYQYVYPYAYTSLPTWCAGDVHVWACEHAKVCRCGKATRKVEPHKCPQCGK